MARRYFAVRTGRTKRAFLMRELQEGRLRQASGYDPCQDLRRIQKKVESGKRLNEEEQDAWRNRRLLDTEPDGARPGDVLVLPNLPEDDLWVLARVAGPYRFANSNESNGVGPGYGHIIQVEPVRDRAGRIVCLDPHSENVDARLRAAMRDMSPMWPIDGLGDAVDKLVLAIEGARPRKRRRGTTTSVDR